jgi:hypothetical protein
MEGRNDLPEDLRTELGDDKTRLVGEVEHLLDSAPSRKIIISKEIQNRFSLYKN